MASGDGVVPVVGLAESQVPPEGVVTLALALNVTADPSLVVTSTFCGVAVPPTVAVKLRPEEPRLSVGTDGGIGVVTLSVTGTDTGLMPALVVVIETLPV